MSFFKQVLATIVGLTIFQIIAFIMFFIFIGIVVSTVSTTGDEFTGDVKIKEQSVLVVDLSRYLSERDGFSDFSFAAIEGFPKEKAGLQSILEAIDFAKSDTRIKGIYLKLSAMPNGYATIDVLRKHLVDFKESDKFIIAYGEMFDQKSYYLSTVADKIYANPEGYIELRGIGARLTFYKKMIEEKLEVEVQVFKVGDFKSAVEPFILEKISDDNRTQLEYLLGGIKEDFLTNVAKDRNISPKFFDQILNNLSGLDPDSCVAYNLIDGTKYFDEVLAELKEKAGVKDKEELNIVNIDDYAMATATVTSSSNKIAVLYADGEIVDGMGDERSIGGEKFAKEIRKLRNDDDIDAIVLRINSPGGSALASEVMWRELELAKQAKPVVVSMGDLAASGGYYIACNADKIYAEENTITGSIGVFGLVPNLEKFLKNKIGITFDDVKLNEHATSNGVTNKLTAFEAQVIQTNVDKVYATFTNRVAEGRGLPIGDVLSVASGRVWTGQQALERGLVDEIGSLNDAIAYAAELAKLDDYRIKEYPEVKSPFQMFFEDFGMESKQGLLKEELGLLYPFYLEVKNFQKIQGKVQARMPFVLEIN
jgi:protease IV